MTFLNRTLALLFGLLFAACSGDPDRESGHSHGRALRVWTVGDSIAHNTYQARLWARACQVGVEIDFLGTQASGFIQDPQDEGYPGFRIAQIQDAITGLDLGGEPAYVLVMAGTNDVLQNKPGADIESDYLSLAESISSERPNARVLLGRPPRTTGSHAIPLEAFAAAVPWIAKISGAEYVDTDVASDKEVGPDLVHPTTDGKISIADAWADAMGF